MPCAPQISGSTVLFLDLQHQSMQMLSAQLQGKRVIGGRGVLEYGVAAADSVEVVAAVLVPAPEKGALEGAVLHQAVMQRVKDGLVGGILSLPLAKLHHIQKSHAFMTCTACHLCCQGCSLDLQFLQQQCKALCPPPPAREVSPGLWRPPRAPQSMCGGSWGPAWPSCLHFTHTQREAPQLVNAGLAISGPDCGLKPNRLGVDKTKRGLGEGCTLPQVDSCVVDA